MRYKSINIVLTLILFNMTLLDTFGDYFNQLFDFNLNNFYKNRKDVFTVQGENLISSNRVVKYSGPYGAVLHTVE